MSVVLVYDDECVSLCTIESFLKHLNLVSQNSAVKIYVIVVWVHTYTWKSILGTVLQRWGVRYFVFEKVIFHYLYYAKPILGFHTIFLFITIFNSAGSTYWVCLNTQASIKSPLLGFL